MLPFREGGVIERKAFEQFNVGCETDTDVRTFNKVMAQQRLFGKAAMENLVECLHVINSLSMEHRLAEQILLRIGDRRTVRIRSLGVREDSGEARRCSTGKRDADARLNN